MATTQLETIARALCTTAGIDPDAQTCAGYAKTFPGGYFLPDMSLVKPAWQQFETQAQAVIDAMAPAAPAADASTETH